VTKPRAIIERRSWISVGLVFCLGGCALTSKGQAVSPRYFSPVMEGTTPRETSDGSVLELRIGRIEAASHLEQRMSFRTGPAELGYYEDRLWSSEPSEYLRDALEQELFERRKIVRLISGAGMTLDVELTAFEEIRSAGAVRLSIRYALHDDRRALVERTLVLERALPGGAGADAAERIAQALGGALASAVSQLSDDVARRLATIPPNPSGTPPVTEPPAALPSSSNAPGSKPPVGSLVPR
jgi:ABC-type uncharacterized transport system auxiliary subunit